MKITLRLFYLYFVLLINFFCLVVKSLNLYRRAITFFVVLILKIYFICMNGRGGVIWWAGNVYDSNVWSPFNNVQKIFCFFFCLFFIYKPFINQWGGEGEVCIVCMLSIYKRGYYIYYVQFQFCFWLKNISYSWNIQQQTKLFSFKYSFQQNELFPSF